jgi:hypothetical protein
MTYMHVYMYVVCMYICVKFREILFTQPILPLYNYYAQHCTLSRECLIQNGFCSYCINVILLRDLFPHF